MTSHEFELENVTVRFPSVTALDSISLTIGTGEQIALVGPSGSGKTTLLRLFNGTVRPSSGCVRVRQVDTRELSSVQLRKLRSQIGFVHQDLSLVPNLNVLQNVLSGRMGRESFAQSLRMILLPISSETANVHQLLKRVGIEDKLFTRTDKLSGGQQQRVAIARALYQQPEAILADEPVSSVDPARANDTIGLLTKICRNDNLTMCVSLHNLDLARKFFPRLIGLREGAIVFDRQTSELNDDEFHRLYQLTEEEMLPDRVES